MRTAQLVERLAAGRNNLRSLLTRTPGLSDPGSRLIRECINANWISQLFPDRHRFNRAGPVPDFQTRVLLRRISANQERSTRTRASRRCGPKETSIISNRLIADQKPLKALTEILLATASPTDGGQIDQLCVARELTKKFEDFAAAPPPNCSRHYEPARPGRDCSPNFR